MHTIVRNGISLDFPETLKHSTDNMHRASIARCCRPANLGASLETPIRGYPIDIACRWIIWRRPVVISLYA